MPRREERVSSATGSLGKTQKGTVSTATGSLGTRQKDLILFCCRYLYEDKTKTVLLTMILTKKIKC